MLSQSNLQIDNPSFKTLNITPVPQTGHNCKITAIASIERYFSEIMDYASIPLHKRYSHSSLISIRQIAKKFGSKQGELLEAKQMEDILNYIGYEAQLESCDTIEKLRHIIFTYLKLELPIITVFAVQRSCVGEEEKGEPSAQYDGENEHAAIIMGYNESTDSVILMHWGEYHSCSIIQLFNSIQCLPEQRTKEIYRSIKKENIFKKYDLVKDVKQEILKESILPEMKSGFKGKLIVLNSPELKKIQEKRIIMLLDDLNFEYIIRKIAKSSNKKTETEIGGSKYIDLMNNAIKTYLQYKDIEKFKGLIHYAENIFYNRLFEEKTFVNYGVRKKTKDILQHVGKNIFYQFSLFEKKDSIEFKTIQKSTLLDYELKPIIKKITDVFSQSFNILWYNPRQQFIMQVYSGNLFLKFKTDYNDSAEYYIYKVSKILNILQKDGTLNTTFMNNNFLEIDSTASEDHYLTIKIPLSAINLIIPTTVNENKKIRCDLAYEDNSFLPLSPYLINTASSEKRELLLWANPLHSSKIIQKRAKNTCAYNALNYIRKRYKASNDDNHAEKRTLEKRWKDYYFDHGKQATIHMQSVSIFKTILPDKLEHSISIEDLLFFTGEIAKLPHLFKYANETKQYCENFFSSIKTNYLKVLKHEYNIVLTSTFAPELKDMEPNILVMLLEDQQLTTFWVENNNLENKSFSEYMVKDIIEKLPPPHKKSMDTDLIESIMLKYMCALTNQTFLDLLTENYFNKILHHNKQFLVKDLGIDYHKSVVNFFNERGFSRVVSFENSLGASIAIIDFILKDTFYKTFDMQFSTWNPLLENSCAKLLDEIALHGPHIICISAFVSSNIPKYLIKNHGGFDIFYINTLDQVPHFGHIAIVIGGEMTRDGNEFIYFIDPNDEYSYQQKPPVYKILFDKFKEYIHSYEKDIRANRCEDDKQDALLSKSFALYGRNGLSLTRDPAFVETSSKTTFDAINLKGHLKEKWNTLNQVYQGLEKKHLSLEKLNTIYNDFMLDLVNVTTLKKQLINTFRTIKFTINNKSILSVLLSMIKMVSQNEMCPLPDTTRKTLAC
jgi:hypothetical protein